MMLKQWKHGLAKSAMAVALAAVAMSAQAHRPWMVPSITMVEGDSGWVTVDAAISEDLFVIDHQPLKLDALQITGPDGASVKPQNLLTGHLRSTFDVEMTQPGTYKASLVQKNVFGSYTVNGEMKRFRGTEEAFAAAVPADAKDVKVSRMFSRLETFFSAGKTTDTVFKPTGTGLEMVPLTHPNDMRTGDKAHWRFLLDGKPAANQAFSLVPGGVRYRGTLGEVRLSTDANGEITFTLPAPGMYMVSSNWPVMPAPVPGQPPSQPALRVSYAATVEILPQ
jgi:uncharacterized GH25 family protein